MSSLRGFVIELQPKKDGYVVACMPSLEEENPLGSCQQLGLEDAFFFRRSRVCPGFFSHCVGRLPRDAVRIQK